ncbi:MAG: slipin family protein [Patescibacteria group bacterium]|jgi:regulator of protease activity HflC (stomatin/prohibitin superfamily)
MNYLYGTIAFVLLIIILRAFRVIQQYEKGVVFRLGKIRSEKNPGFRFIIPLIDNLRKVSLRIVTMPVPAQKIITKDNVSIDVAAVAYYRVKNATKSLVAIQNVDSAINQIAQTTVRNIVGQFMLDQVLSETVKINERIKEIIDVHTEAWGVEVTTVEIKDIQLPETMQRAMAKQAEAEREKRAKIIAAEGELLSAKNLGAAADIISDHPIALQLRNLQVLTEIAVEKNSTIVFPNSFFSTINDVRKFLNLEK